MDLDATLGQTIGEGAVLLAGLACPHDIVEQQLLTVLGREAVQLQTGLVEHDLLEVADL